VRTRQAVLPKQDRDGESGELSASNGHQSRYLLTFFSSFEWKKYQEFFRFLLACRNTIIGKALQIEMLFFIGL